MVANNYISIFTGSRELDRRNLGDLNVYVDSIRKSVYDIRNIEIIFKFDDDDFLIQDIIDEVIKNNPDMNIKYFFSPRYGYLGLHKAYYECLERVDPESRVITTLADDFLFKENSHWDKELIENSYDIKDEPFIVQDPSKIGVMHDAPFFSRKLVDLIGLGHSLSTDGLLVHICSMYTTNNLEKYIIDTKEFSMRKWCEFDGSHQRWNVEREELMAYQSSDEYKEYLQECENTISEYFKIKDFKTVLNNYQKF